MNKFNFQSLKHHYIYSPRHCIVFCWLFSFVLIENDQDFIRLDLLIHYILGGTIDITVHEVTSSGGLKEVHAASGGGWGGILVDQAFEELMVDIIGQQIYSKFVKKETEDWLDLWRMFEVKKKTIDPHSNAKINIKLPMTLIELYKNETQRELKDRIAERKYSSQIQVSGDKLRFESRLLQSLFNNSIEKTVMHVKSLLQDSKARGVKAILMVGGFSDSPMLQQAIKRQFSNLKIIIPKEASSAILRGAVIFGHNPAAITQRVLKRTYGTDISPDFQTGVHDKRYKMQTDTGLKCDNVFEKYVEKGQWVEVGETLAGKDYIPVYHNQKTIGFQIFASDLKDPKYVHQGCQLLGELDVDISDVPGDLDRSVSLSLTFGDTEIQAEGRVEGTDRKVSAKFDFLG